jgi:hypothetical protein
VRAAAEDALRLQSHLSAQLPGLLSCDEKHQQRADNRKPISAPSDGYKTERNP